MIPKNNGQIRVVHLEAVLMPNGELISAGKTVGMFNTHKEYLHEADKQNDELCFICNEPMHGLVQVHHHNEKCGKCGSEMFARQKHECS